MDTERAKNRLPLLLAAGLVAVGFAVPARADDPKTRASDLFHEASGAYAHGQFAQAAGDFEESDRLVPRAAALYNAAVAWEAAGDPARAADDYQAALDRGELAPDQAAGVRKQLDLLSGKLGTVEVLAPPDAHIAVGAVEGQGPRLRLHMEPGPHDIHVTRVDGRVEVRTVEAKAGRTDVVRFEDTVPAPVPPPPLPASTAPPPPPAPPARPLARPFAPREPSHPARTVGWVALGTAAGFSAAAIVLGVETLNSLHSFEGSADMDQGAHDDAVRYRLLANVAWSIAGGAALLGGTLLVVSLTGSHETSKTGLAVEGGFGSVCLTGRY